MWKNIYLLEDLLNLKIKFGGFSSSKGFKLTSVGTAKVNMTNLSQLSLNYFSVFFSLNGNDHRHLNYTTRLARRCQADWAGIIACSTPKAWSNETPHFLNYHSLKMAPLKRLFINIYQFHSINWDMHFFTIMHSCFYIINCNAKTHCVLPPGTQICQW